MHAYGCKEDELQTFDNFACEFDTEPIYDEYDEDYMSVCLSHNHIPQEFNLSEALDMVSFHNQCVAIPDETMHYDMIVGNKADFNTIRSARMKLKRWTRYIEKRC